MTFSPAGARTCEMFDEGNQCVEIALIEIAESRHRCSGHAVLNDPPDIFVRPRMAHKVGSAASKAGQSMTERTITAINRLPLVHLIL